MADMTSVKRADKTIAAPAADVAAGERVVVLIKTAAGAEKEVLSDESVPAGTKIVAADLAGYINAKLTDV